MHRGRERCRSPNTVHVPRSYTWLAVDETLEIDYADDTNSWDAWVTKINSALNPLDLEFAHLFDEATGKDTYALVRAHYA